METPNRRITRRDFLAASGAVGAGVVLAGPLGFTGLAEAARSIPRVTFGKTGEKVSILAFGGTVNVTVPLLHAALSEDITYLDAAQGYGGGNCERTIGEVLERTGRRKDCFLVTKSGYHDVTRFAESLERDSFPRLRTDYVDLYFLHNLGDPDRLDDELKATAERLKKEKKIRFFGFSCHHANLVPTLNRAAEVGFVDALMFKYNFRDYNNDELNRAIDKCAKAGIGLVAMKTQGGAVSFEDRVAGFEGKGFNRFQAALKAVWSDSRIHTLASAMKSIQQVRENATAAREKSLGALERERLQRYGDATSHLYCRGCAGTCEPCVNAPVRIADTLRYRMYYEYYGDHTEARRLFRELPSEARQIADVDFSAAEAACPYRVPIGRLMRESARNLA